MDEFLELVLSPDQRLVFALKDAIPGSGKDIAVLSESLAKIFMYKGKVISLIEQLIIAEVNATSKKKKKTITITITTYIHTFTHTHKYILSFHVCVCV